MVLLRHDPSIFQYLCYAKQLYLKNERGAAGDARLRELAIAHLGRDIDLPFVAHTHLLHSDYPPLNEVA